MNEMQNNYTEKLNELINSKAKGFTFCGMTGSDESPVADDGIYVEASWGIILSDPNARKFYEKMGCKYQKEYPSTITNRTTSWLVFKI